MTDHFRRRIELWVAVVASAISGVPLVSAHGGASYFPSLHQWYALVPIVLGVGVVGLASYLRRGRYEHRPSRALGLVLLGLTLVVVGAIGLVQLSPVTSLASSQETLGRNWMKPTAFVLGLFTIVTSLVVGRYRWPTRPRYAMVGVVFGLWITYPAVMDAYRPLQNPLGYLLFAAGPVAIGYVLWRDCAGALRAIFSDRVARRFGAAVAVLGLVFFMFSSGMLTMLPDPTGVNLPWNHPLIGVLPIADPLVLWPAVEFWFPSVPLGGYLSVGMIVMIAMIVGLIAANGAFVAYQWRCRGKTGVSGTTGAAALAAPNACCCCGPVISQIAVVAVGPTAAMPIYWLFIDTSSPLGVVFFVVSLVMLLGNVVRFSTALDPSSVEPIDTDSGIRPSSS